MTQETQGLYWFGPPLWCNTLLQCVVGGLPLGLMRKNNTRGNGLARACSCLGDELLGGVRSPFSLSRCSVRSWILPIQIPLLWGWLVLFIGKGPGPLPKY